MHAGHRSHFARPQASRVDHVLALDVSLVGDHRPGRVGALRQVFHLGVEIDFRTGLSRGDGHRLRGAVGIDVAFVAVEQSADHVARVHDRAQPPDVLGREKFTLNAEHAVARVLVANHFPARFCRRDLYAAGHVHAGVLPADFLDFLVDGDSVRLQPRDIEVGVHRVEAAGGVPGGPGRQLLSFYEDDVGPAEFCQVVQQHASFRCGHRIHVPITTNRRVWFTIDGRPYQLEVGQAYEVNNQKQHSVANRGAEERITFIFDYIPPGPLKYPPGQAKQRTA